jgi:hypothetical protein
MSGPVCPACGIAVVPGYVRCPKCHKPLPHRPSQVVGGTAVQTKSHVPLFAVIGAVVIGLGIIAFFGLRTSDKPAAQPSARVAPTATTATPEAAPTPAQPEVQTPTGPNAIEVAADLERSLKRKRLWATVGVVGDRADVRSGSCSDPAMEPMLEAAAPSFKAAGLTKLRCLEQSGRVVTTRDL